jgi:hypothetical protein
VLRASGQTLAIDTSGLYRGILGVEAELFYLVDTGNGQEIHSPEEFAGKFGWRNNPNGVHRDAR